MAEYDHNEIQDIIEHRINDKMEIIVFTDISDLKQSNIGVDEAFVNDQNETKVEGNKIFIYFNGDHRHLRRQIREGIAAVYLNAMLYGSNIQEIVQNSVLNTLPEWFSKGIIAFSGERWNTDLDNNLKDYLLGDHKKISFEHLTEINPRLAGHSMWYFISQNYSTTTISNLLYLTRINRSIDNGFLYVLGIPFREIEQDWLKHYTSRYEEEDKLHTSPIEENPLKIKKKHKDKITEIALSPDGRHLAYVTNEIGKTKVWIHNLQTGENRSIFKNGFRNAIQATDYDYPHIAWHPNGKDIAVVYEKQDKLYILISNVDGADDILEVLPPQYERILDMDFVSGYEIAFTAIVNGFSDLFIFQTNSRSTRRITNDFFDDLDVAYGSLLGMKGLLFTSNRNDTILVPSKLDTILPLNYTDVFFYPFESENEEIVRITNTPYTNEYEPIVLDSTHFAYLSDRSGKRNREAGYLKILLAYHEQVIIQKGEEILIPVDSIWNEEEFGVVDTSFVRPVYKPRAFTYNQAGRSRNILAHHSNPKRNVIGELVMKDGDYWVYSTGKNAGEQTNMQPTFFKSDRDEKLKKEKKSKKRKDQPDIIYEEIIEKKEEDNKGYLFQSEFDDDIKEVQKTIPADTLDAAAPEVSGEPVYITRNTTTVRQGENERSVIKFRPSRIVPYRLKFRSERLSVRLDNELLFDGLETFAGTNEDGFNVPVAGILLKTQIRDLFEDYTFTLGVRYPTSFNGSEYFMVFDNNKNRLDKRFALYRYSQKQSQAVSFTDVIRSKSQSYIGLTRLRYPLDIFRSVRLTGTLRLDQFTRQATELNTLNEPTIREQRLGIKGEYVFDNTIDIMPNIMHGTRYKIYAEFVKRFEVSLLDGFSFDLTDKHLANFGFDVRHYERLFQYSVFASRFTAGTSVGTERILYYLGGTENWLFGNDKFNQDTSTPQTGDFAYRTIVPNMRGFRYNIRNGGSFALVNAELRVPIFRYISNRIRSNFVRNFQVIGFFDVGTAWEGSDPYSSDNPLNIVELSNPPTVNVRVQYFRDPLVAGYGFGVRTTVLGYFLRFDYAWGIESREVLKPRAYLSLGYDF
jgi:Tol biopolymer transport system component